MAQSLRIFPLLSVAECCVTPLPPLAAQGMMLSDAALLSTFRTPVYMCVIATCPPGDFFGGVISSLGPKRLVSV